MIVVNGYRKHTIEEEWEEFTTRLDDKKINPKITIDEYLKTTFYSDFNKYLKDSGMNYWIYTAKVRK